MAVLGTPPEANLVKLLAGIMEPQIPSKLLDEKNLESFLRQLLDYIRRLQTRFTPETLGDSIGGGKPDWSSVFTFNIVNGQYEWLKPPDHNIDYILAYDGTTHVVKWIETTTDCPPP